MVGNTGNFWALPRRGSFWGSGDDQPIQLTSEFIDYRRFTLNPEADKLFALAKEWDGELLRKYLDEWVRYDFSPEPKSLFLDFFPEGESVAFVRFPEGTLWKSQMDGGGKRRLTEPSVLAAAFPRWSPDGQQIVFTMKGWSQRGGRVYVIGADGAGGRRVIEEEYLQHSGSWRPDGRLLVSSALGGIPLRLVDLKSGEVEDIPESEGLKAAVYSPDGRYIAAQRTGGDEAGFLALYDAETESWSTVPNAHPRDVLLWSHDSKYLHFTGPPRTLYRLQIATQTVEEVTDFDDFGAQSPLAWGKHSFWFTFDPNDDLIACRLMGAVEIYKMDLELP
jgi:dipeptidyl aminopeptidase/acylaminoacyl peptidase